MGAVSGVAVRHGSTEPPGAVTASGGLTPAEVITGHPLPPPPTVELWLTSFRWDLIIAAGCASALVVYLRWVRRLRARGDRWPLTRTACAVTGLVPLGWVTSGGPAVYGHVLFSAHMIQHMVLIMVVPIFLALSALVTLAAHALPVRHDASRGPREWLLRLVHSRCARFWSHPVVAAGNFAGSIVIYALRWPDRNRADGGALNPRRLPVRQRPGRHRPGPTAARVPDPTPAALRDHGVPRVLQRRLGHAGDPPCP